MQQKEKKRLAKLFIISAPSGAGKTSITEEVLKRLHSTLPIERVITYTSRQSRKQEVNGRDYYFISRADFEQKRQNGFFLEAVEYNGNLYGSPASIIKMLEQGTSLIIIPDYIGAQKIAKLIPNAVLIWIMPPDLITLEERLHKRGTEDESIIQQRMQIAKKEIEYENQHKFFTYWVINRDFDKAAQEVIEIIIKELA